MNGLLALAAVSEAATGLLLLVYPPIVSRLLFGAEIAGAGVVVSRIAGISLIALGLACLPTGGPVGGDARGLRGMLGYSLLATCYLIYLGFGGEWVGILLWPAVAVHASLTMLLGMLWLNEQK